MKLVVRLGAWGDMLGITPLVRELKECYVLTKRIGQEILKYNPYVKKIIPHNDKIPNEKLSAYFKAIADAHESEVLDLNECWEVKLARHPAQPNFKYPKTWAEKHCDINYYEQIFKLAGMTTDNYLPEMFFSDEEEEYMKEFCKDLKPPILIWGLSGSSINKTYPYVPEVIFPYLEKYKGTVITVGDELCQVLESELKHERIINKSGKWTIRQSCLAAKYANIVIAPDTGMLHAAGCWDTPKIGLLNHTSINNITKHFKNDYSLHAGDYSVPFWGKVTCAPCYKIHYSKVTCNLTEIKGAAAPVCLAAIKPERILRQIKEVL